MEIRIRLMVDGSTIYKQIQNSLKMLVAIVSDIISQQFQSGLIIYVVVVKVIWF